MHVEDHDLLADAIRDDDAPAQGIEVRYAKPSGDIAWTSLRLAHLSGSHRRPGLMLALTEDITREKRVEAELRQAQKMEAIGQLTGGIAHDFNNLLGVIIGNVEFLLDPLSGVDQEELSREILRSALSGADLTRRLLAFSRRQTLQPRRIDPQRLPAEPHRHPAPAARRADHHHDQPGGRAVADAGRSLADRRRTAEPDDQRAPRHAVRRHAGDRDRQCPLRAGRRDAGGLCRAVGG
ncbi:MAG: histidine kinase dimerization/phospho-acceptor domain-containing protein [Acetobacteraceae bacterium]